MAAHGRHETASPPSASRALIRITGVALLLGAAGAVVASETWNGPIVLSLSSDHGVDAGDLLVFPLVALAIAIARRTAWRPLNEAEHTAALGSRAVPISALVLGTLLLAGVVAKSGGGPLVPSGGGTFDGTIRQTSGTTAVPVDRWSYVALTYDGGVLRLYVDGREVSNRRTSGAIQTTDTPVWIGGNLPYGEHFRGLIDEVRIYNCPLRGGEIREDMATPVRHASGLEAAYGFDAGSGTRAADASGHGNAGRIEGATWTHGRYGDALRFDGDRDVVRVPPSPSLDLKSAMTLSGWVEPTTSQKGWRTIVERQADAYLLTASSDRQNRGGWVDDLRAALLIGAAIWFCVAIATDRSAWSVRRRLSWGLPVGLFVAGALADAALAPTGTLIGPTLVAVWLAATASTRAGIVGFSVAAASFIGLTLGSVGDMAGVGDALSRNGGAIARATALGALFALAGAGRLMSARPTARLRFSHRQ
jgi:hypothetical protein